MRFMNDTILLEDLEIYKLALEIGEGAWNKVSKWQYFPQKGYGRYFYKDRKQFCYYGRGSLMETKTGRRKPIKEG